MKKSAEITKILREEKLLTLLEAENSKKRMDGRKGVTRHSRFGTTVMIQNVSLRLRRSICILSVPGIRK